MRRLVVRIFLWFWLALAAVAALLIVSSPLFTRDRPGVERWQRDAESALAARLQRVATRVERGLWEGQHGERRHGRGVPPIFLLDPEGVPVDGREPPERVPDFARRVAAAGEEISERAGTLHLLGRPAVAPDGTRYIVVTAFRRPPRLVDLLEPRVLAWRLALLVLVVGALSFWLSSYLTSPVTSLRGAVRRLAGGDLAARVGPVVGRRRDELGDLARDVDLMASRIEALVDAQRRLVRDVSHELRSPLARLQVALELARRKVGPEAGPGLDRIEREATRLEELVGQLLTLSRLEAADRPTRDELFDLAMIVGEVASDAEFEASGRGLTVALEAGEPVPVTGDPEALRSAVENVLRNAIRYGGEGSEVAIEVRHDRGEAVVRIADRGPGVPEEKLDRLFEPFVRVDDARTRSSGGAGLGLSIAARAVRLHGGGITARNRDGGGLEVEVRLPGTDQLAATGR